MEEQRPEQNISGEIQVEPVRIVLPDECGDSLWDMVLQQDKKCIYPAGSCERGGLLNNVTIEHNDKKEFTLPGQDEPG